MGRTGRYFDQLESTFGKGSVTSGYRTQQEQDALVAQGATKATRSAHTYRDGYDLQIGVAGTPEQLHDRLTKAGMDVAYIRRESGHGQNQGTGPHWHIELGKPGQGGTRMAGGGTQPSNGRGQIGVLDAASAAARTPTTPKETRASTGVGVGPTDKIFNSDGELTRNFQAIDQNLQETSQKLDVLGQAQLVAHGVQVASKRQQLSDTQAVSDEITQGVTQLKRSVMPVFEARQRINDQLDHVNTMNPIERGLRGIFDLNYDREFLTGQLDSYDRTLKARADDFNYLNHLNGIALTEIDRRYAMANEMPALAVAQGKEDLGLLGMNLANLSGMLQNNQAEVSNQVQMIQAKQAARGDLLDRLDVNTIGDLATQAQQAGGAINYHGMDFSYHELHERMVKNEQQQLGLESMRISIQGQRMDIAEKQAVNIVQTMTKGQLEAAMQNGGVWQGVQLPQDALTSAYQGILQREQLQGQAYMEQIPAANVGQFITQDANQNVALINRSAGLFGAQTSQQVVGIFNEQTALYRQLHDAIKAGQPPAVINGIQAMIAANSKRIGDQVDKTILDSAGGDKRAAGYISAFVHGTPINAGTATEAMTYFAIKGGMPEGMMASPEAREIFRKAQSIVQANRLDDNGKPRSLEALQMIVTQQLGETAFKTVGQVRFDRMWNDFPTLAKKVGDPFGKMDPAKWDEIRTQAALDGWTAIAPKIGTSVANVRQMATTGKRLSDSPADVELFKKFNAAANTMNTVEMQSMITKLDELPSLQPGTDNSEVMLNFLRSGATQNMAGIYTQTAQSNGMGDFFVGPLANGALERNLQNQGQLIQATRADVTADKRATSRKLESGWAGNSLARSQFVLTSIPGVGKQGAQALMPFMKSVLQTTGNQVIEGATTAMSNATVMGIPVPQSNYSLLQRQEAAMKDALSRAKFDDPALEAYRRAAIRGWDESSTQANGYMEQLLDALSPGM